MNIRDSLPEGDCRQVYDIIRWHTSSGFDTSDPQKGAAIPTKEIAQKLEITIRAVKEHIETIKKCLADENDSDKEFV